MPEPILAADGAKVILSSSFVAGFLGSCISLRFTPPMKWWERITATVSGAVMAQYITPLVVHFLDIESLSAAVGFLIGLLGLSLTAALYNTIKDARPWDLVMSRFGGANNVDQGEGH